ncbi:LacI family DNA-binding transcriptional regulator [Nonomuraea sp. NEAU-A123]|uniref:LacI family DNA-binding transcriptional regulator n=1 Tax=Nonomuraea sp. NEAU-A123 TaxID=2839649 RepID=UPI001BE3DFC5|nr:LacI family DNA-binding transcriptional regulator [Nonomuraea sp. NEAU-A123]MBT2229318.1 LacI family transcriptional regulator [Nonomuraea sp. NEAU-A123]
MVEASPDGRPTPATLHDVAREAGVSVATASRALNGSTRNVRTENVSRVLAAAAKLDYEPHLSAQAIAKGSTRTAALVVGDVADPYFSSIAAGVTRAAEAAGLIVTMAVADRSPERELEIVRTLRGQRPRVIIIAGSRVDGAGTRDALVEELAQYRTAGGRVVLISQQDLPFGTVTIDNRGGAGQLARALAGAGYRRFAVIRAPERVRTSRERVDGFTEGLREAGVSLDDRFVVETEFTRAGGYAAARELAGRGLDGIEVVFAVNDVMAIGAMTAFRDAGLVPGEDIAVAGFDDIGSAVDVVPALTSVAVPLEEAGASAMRLALAEGSETVRIETRVILRESTPPR